MNEVINNIYKRRAVREYKDIPVEKDLICRIIAAGKMAPSAMNRQPWKFYVLTDKNKIRSYSKEIAHIALQGIKDLSLKELVKVSLSLFHFSTITDLVIKSDHVFYGAPVVIFITSPKDDEWGALDVGMCAQNMMLAARSIGLETCPVGFAKFVMKTPDYHLLNIPDTDVVQLAIIIGYGDEHPKEHEMVDGNVFYV
ncbi:nitroreductase [Mucilaginibacter sp.]|uniref:nitroreductase n=1 Tax=Mucilaginibacter sp. TaxID=1882438 RepID=UPI0028491F6B|nr:nitroreductase [Mucilaginibacter sp.]MDR3697413.1 nitroreductase [Mucilaginibacter sp.]